MHTTCPECSSVFRVTAAHLNAAHGQVRCGYCQAIFNALGNLEDDWDAHLQDGPQSDTQIAPDDVDQAVDENALLDNLLSEDNNDERPPEPSLEEDEPSALAELMAGDDKGPAVESDYRQHAEEPIDSNADVHSEKESFSLPNDAEMEDLIAQDEDIADYVRGNEVDNDHAADTPHILREELAAITGKRGSPGWVWPLGIVLLLAALLFQGFYYFRDALAKDESYRGLVVSMCKVLSCEVPLRNDAARGINTLQMVTHSIDKSPESDQQLQIKAIFSNTATYSQAYPRLQIKMTDESGKVTAMRRLQPQEYLGEHIDIKQGLPALTSVEIIVDILKPQAPILSYQLDFL